MGYIWLCLNNKEEKLAVYNVEDKVKIRHISCGPRYDLVVVGGGISGLTAAYQYHLQYPKAKIMIIEKRHRLGGHAFANTHSYKDKDFICPGGGVMIEDAGITAKLMRDLEIPVDQLKKFQISDVRNGAFSLKSVMLAVGQDGRRAHIMGDIFPFARRGEDGCYNLRCALISHPQLKPVEEWLDLKVDVLKHLSNAEKERYLKDQTYDRFIKTFFPAVYPWVVDNFSAVTKVKFGGLLEDFSAFELLTNPMVALPGLHTLGAFGEALDSELQDQLRSRQVNGVYGQGGTTILTDILENKCRTIPNIDLITESEVYQVANRENLVEIYHEHEGTRRVSMAKSCILSIPHSVVSQVCCDLTKEACRQLGASVRVPNITATILLRTGRILDNLGASSFYFPSEIFSEGFAFDYEYPHVIRDEPVCLFLIGTVHGEASDLESRCEEGRKKMSSWKENELDTEIREQLSWLLVDQDFQPERDLLSISINKWPDGFMAKMIGEDATILRLGNIFVGGSQSLFPGHATSAIEVSSKVIDEIKKGRTH